MLLFDCSMFKLLSIFRLHPWFVQKFSVVLILAGRCVKLSQPSQQISCSRCQLISADDTFLWILLSYSISSVLFKPACYCSCLCKPLCKHTSTLASTISGYSRYIQLSQCRICWHCCLLCEGVLLLFSLSLSFLCTHMSYSRAIAAYEINSPTLTKVLLAELTLINICL